MKIYQSPEYYEIAFSFRNLAREVDFFEAAIAKFSKVAVHDVFEMASGTCPYLAEWHQRGYRHFGLDASAEMIRFARRKAAALHADLTLFRGDMSKFRLGARKFDFAYVLLGSLYVRSNAEFLTHLDSVARVLRRGSLYLLDGVVRFNFLRENKEHWTMKRPGITVTTTYQPELIDALEQRCIEHVMVEVNDHGKRIKLDSGIPRKIFFPQELLLLIQLHRKFEFLGRFTNFSLREPRGAEGRHTVILRKR